MSSLKHKVIKKTSKLGKIIFNDKLPDEYSNTSGKGCEYIYGDPLEDFHYCGKPLHEKRYCEEHYAICYTTKVKTKLVTL